MDSAGEIGLQRLGGRRPRCSWTLALRGSTVTKAAEARAQAKTDGPGWVWVGQRRCGRFGGQPSRSSGHDNYLRGAPYDAIKERQPAALRDGQAGIAHPRDRAGPDGVRLPPLTGRPLRLELGRRVSSRR